VFEREDRIGGLLMYGIPNMKLDKDIVARRIKKMTAEGIDFHCGTEIGKDIPGEDLKKNFDAVILCCGARKARELEAEGSAAAGKTEALDYLTAATKAVLQGTESEISAKGRHVVIVGNGDTAADCLATALRQGALSVIQLVRKPKPEAGPRVWPYPARGEMTGYGQEEAVSLFGNDPRMYGATVKKLIADETGALRSVVIRSGAAEQELTAELLLTATGFSGAEPETAHAFGLALDDRGRLGGADFGTDDPRVFACGDMRRGASLVVWAIREGRACAKAVDEALEGYTNL
jgi:glutamate synthase (NADPH/NADH) small chain